MGAGGTMITIDDKTASVALRALETRRFILANKSREGADVSAELDDIHDAHLAIARELHTGNHTG